MKNNILDKNVFFISYIYIISIKEGLVLQKKKIRNAFLSKSCQNVMKYQIFDIGFSKSLLVKSPKSINKKIKIYQIQTRFNDLLILECTNTQVLVGRQGRLADGRSFGKKISHDVRASGDG